MSDWVRKTDLSSRRQLQIKQQNGEQEGLYVITRTEYEQNSKTGEIRPVQQDNVKTVTVFTEIPNGAKTVDGKDLWTEAKAAGTEYWYQDANARRYVAQFGLNTVRTSTAGAAPTISNQTFTTQFAGAALRNDVANWKNGKTADFTDNAFALANQSAIIRAADDANVVVTNLSGNLGIARSQNNATLQPTNGGGGGDKNPTRTSNSDEPDSDPVTFTNTAVVLKGREVKKTEKTLRYPLEIIDGQEISANKKEGQGQDYLQIGIIQYKPVGSTFIRDRTNNSLAVGSNKKAADYQSTVILPIPSNIQDGNSVSYADGSLDGITAAVAGATNTVINDFNGVTLKEVPKQTAAAARTMFGALNSMGNDLKNEWIRGLAARAASLPGIGNITREQLLARESGGILNPNMELFFNGVALRSFKFSFKLTPRNKPEADMIKEIIRTLKINMAPKIPTGNNNYLLTPNVFELAYKKGNQDHPFLHKFKQCALTDMSVNYTGDGIYATYADATPISMIMDLTFKELEPIYDSDYDSVGGVGY